MGAELAKQPWHADIPLVVLTRNAAGTIHRRIRG